MKQNFLRFIIPCLVLLAFTGQALAEDVYVKNKPFKGTTLGTGMSTELSLEALAKALDMTVRENNGRWILGTHSLPGRDYEGEILVPLSALKNEGFVVMLSPELGTIDITAPKESAADKAETAEDRQAAASNWGANAGGSGTLVYFGAPW